jgi:hypothetical protein
MPSSASATGVRRCAKRAGADAAAGDAVATVATGVAPALEGISGRAAGIAALALDRDAGPR